MQHHITGGRAAIASTIACGAFLLLVAGCSHTEGSAASAKPPVAIELLRGARWDSPHEGYDPTLPGYRLVGGISTIALASSEVPEEFVLEIRTTTAHRPNIEGFTVRWADTLMQIAPFTEAARAEITAEQEGTDRSHAVIRQSYFVFTRDDSVVRIRFLLPGLRLILTGCTLSWVDWYRD